MRTPDIDSVWIRRYAIDRRFVRVIKIGPHGVVSVPCDESGVMTLGEPTETQLAYWYKNLAPRGTEGFPVSPISPMLRRNVLSAAVAIAASEGLAKITRAKVARRCAVSVGTVSNAFGSLDALRTEVMREAVAAEMLTVIAQGLAIGDETARNAPPDLRDRALMSLAQ